MRIHRWFPILCSCEECRRMRNQEHELRAALLRTRLELINALNQIRELRRKAAHHIRWTFHAGDFSISGDHITMNANPGQKIGFTIDGKDAGGTLDLTNLKVSTSDSNVATVEGSNNADNTAYTGTVHFVGVGACSLDADDLLVDGRDIKASAGLNVVAPATLEIVLDPAGPVAGP